MSLCNIDLSIDELLVILRTIKSVHNHVCWILARNLSWLSLRHTLLLELGLCGSNPLVFKWVLSCGHLVAEHSLDTSIRCCILDLQLITHFLGGCLQLKLAELSGLCLQKRVPLGEKVLVRRCHHRRLTKRHDRLRDHRASLHACGLVKR